MAARPLPHQDYLHECFSYDRETGALTWKPRPLSHFSDVRLWKIWNTKFSGMPAGGLGGGVHGNYLLIRLDHTRYYHHRIVWKIMTGNEVRYIDHINRTTTDNRWSNLRSATRTQNNGNTKRRSQNLCGLKGVQPRESGKFSARICINGRHIYIGQYDTVESAHAAYCEAAKRHFGEFWNPG